MNIYLQKSASIYLQKSASNQEQTLQNYTSHICSSPKFGIQISCKDVLLWKPVAAAEPANRPARTVPIQWRSETVHRARARAAGVARACEHIILATGAVQSPLALSFLQDLLLDDGLDRLSKRLSVKTRQLPGMSCAGTNFAPPSPPP